MNPIKMFQNLTNSAGTIREVARVKNLRVLKTLLGPAYRGLVKQVSKGVPSVEIPAGYTVVFDT